jgi:hypothetical protein
MLIISSLYSDQFNLKAYIVKDGFMCNISIYFIYCIIFYFCKSCSFRDICDSAPVAVKTTLSTLREKQNAGLEEAFR